MSLWIDLFNGEEQLNTAAASSPVSYDWPEVLDDVRLCDLELCWSVTDRLNTFRNELDRSRLLELIMLPLRGIVDLVDNLLSNLGQLCPVFLLISCRQLKHRRFVIDCVDCLLLLVVSS